MALSRRRKRKAGDPTFQDAPNAIVAAASRLNRASAVYGQRTIPKAAWQAEAWRQYEINPELKYAATWMANSLSRCRILAADVDAKGEIVGETADQEVLDIINGLVGSPVRMAEMLSDLAIQLFTPGDSYVIAEPNALGVFAKWYVVSIDELSRVGDDRVAIDTGDGIPYYLSTDSNLITRIYHPHARKSWEADSPVRAALPVLREIEEYGRYINAIISSRLAGAGILGVPSEMNFPSPPEGLQPGETPFMAFLTKAMLAPISDLSDPSAVVPIVIEAPADALAAIQWIVNPQGVLTNVPAELRDAALSRLAIGLDLPAEVIKGASSANHWGQWAIEEQSIKLHIEPLMILICASLTEGFLIPALDAAGLDTTKFVLWFDSTELVLRPDRSTDAKDLYDRGALSQAALLRETGFVGVMDEPSGKEKAIRDAMSIIAASPRAGDALLPLLMELFDFKAQGIPQDIIDQVTQAVSVDGTPPQASAPDPNANPKALPDAPVKQPANPPVQNPTRTGVVASVPATLAMNTMAEILAMNAFSRAGAMLAGRKAEFKDVPKHDVHTLAPASDAEAARILASLSWDAYIPTIVGLGCDPVAFVGAVNEYVSHALTQGEIYDAVALRAKLDEWNQK